MSILAERLVDRVRRIRGRLSEIRTTGLIPTARMRVEDIVSQVRERVSASGGIGFTREKAGIRMGSVGKEVRKKIRGL